MSSRTIPRKSILANFENDPRIHPFLPRTHIKHVLSCFSVVLCRNYRNYGLLRFYRKISKSRFSRLRSSIWEKWWVLDYVSWPFITEIDVLWYLKDTSAHLAPCWWSVITILIKFRETGPLVRPLLKKGWATGTLRVFQPIGSMLVKINHTFSWYLIDYLDQHAINCQFLPKFFASNASSFFLRDDFIQKPLSKIPVRMIPLSQF